MVLVLQLLICEAKKQIYIFFFAVSVNSADNYSRLFLQEIFSFAPADFGKL